MHPPYDCDDCGTLHTAWSVQQEGRPVMGGQPKRSAPGRGSTVRIFTVLDGDEFLGVGEGGWSLCQGVGEDFAASTPPAVVKVDPSEDPRRVAVALRSIADWLERSGFEDISVMPPGRPQLRLVRPHQRGTGES